MGRGDITWDCFPSRRALQLGPRNDEQRVSNMLAATWRLTHLLLRYRSMDIATAARELHRKHRGKIFTGLSIPIENRDDLALAYTPGVGQISQDIAADPTAVDDYTIKRRTVAVITDGSAVLGLGNIGPLAALPVMEGKAALFKRFGDVDAFPICLDTQDVEEIIATVKRIAPVFGGINLEDISAPRCFEIEQRLQAELDIPVLHDDQWGTAVVVLAALQNACRVRGTTLTTAKIVINGAGAAGIAIARLLLTFGGTDLVLCDSHGPIYRGRPDTLGSKKELAELTNIACHAGLDNPQCAIGTLADALTSADVFIGVSKADLLTADLIKQMATQPIIFALANPTPEIMPTVAKAAGAFIVATGRSDFPNQVNNVLVFPGLFRGALDHRVQRFTPAMLINAAAALAALVPTPTVEQILPDPFTSGIAAAIAAAVK